MLCCAVLCLWGGALRAGAMDMSAYMPKDMWRGILADRGTDETALRDT